MELLKVCVNICFRAVFRSMPSSSEYVDSGFSRCWLFEVLAIMN
jgi:hypothetical protein